MKLASGLLGCQLDDKIAQMLLCRVNAGFKPGFKVLFLPTAGNHCRSAARVMKRKAASGSVSKQPANTISCSKVKQVAWTPVDTDQEADEVLHGTAPTQKV